jgi:signal transduction histidine kinase
MWDPDRIAQALGNIVTNALEHGDLGEDEENVVIVVHNQRRADTRHGVGGHANIRSRGSLRARPAVVCRGGCEGVGAMNSMEDLSFEVYVRTPSRVVTIVRDVSFRTAHVLARHHADTRQQPVYIHNRSTHAVETVGPSRC